MRRVTSAEFVRNFSAACDQALAEPVVLTRNGRDRLVVSSLEQYRHILSLALINADAEEDTDRIAAELASLVEPGELKAG